MRNWQVHFNRRFYNTKIVTDRVSIKKLARIYKIGVVLLTKFDLTDIYRNLPLQIHFIILLNRQDIFTKVYHKLGHKANRNKF